MEFIPCPIDRIPTSALEEYRQIYDDLRYVAAGRPLPKRGGSDSDDDDEVDGSSSNVNAGGPPLTQLAVRAGFLVNGIKFAEEELAALFEAMDPEASGAIGFERFASCLHALSVQDQEVLNAWHYGMFPDSEITAETATGILLWRRRIHRALEDPQSSWVARVISILMVVTILVSTISFVLETYPAYKGADTADDFGTIEKLCVAIFTVEYGLRLLCTPERLSVWCMRFLNVVDLASIFPFYLEQAVTAAARTEYDGTGTGASVLRAIRLFRVFRLMKIGQYMTWMRLFGKTVAASGAALGMMALVVFMSLLTAASVEYFIERGYWVAPTGNGTLVVDPYGSDVIGASSTASGGVGGFVMANGATWFSSVPESLWWAVISMTTTGYGDTYPITPLGRLAATGAFLVGLLLFAIPISVISGAFHGEYNRMENLKRLRAEHSAQSGVPGLEKDPGLQQEEEEEKEAATATAAAAAAADKGNNAAASTTAAPAADVTAPVDNVNIFPSANGGIDGGHLLRQPSLQAADGTYGQLVPSSDNSGTGSSADSGFDTAPPTDLRRDERWSEPFLRSVLRVIRFNRRRLMSKLKIAELQNREEAVTGVETFLKDIPARERARLMVKKADAIVGSNAPPPPPPPKTRVEQLRATVASTVAATTGHAPPGAASSRVTIIREAMAEASGREAARKSGITAAFI